jgi:uncharacterized phage protein gp47/JayE
MTDFGVTSSGFMVKPFQSILSDKTDRARQMFGADVDLRSTSSLRKFLDLSSYEDLELWKGMEQLYYSNFISTASGDALGLLGTDAGIQRRNLYATGEMKFTLANPAPGRTYNLPLGTLLETDAPVQRFRTLDLVTLSDQSKVGTVAVQSLARGPQGNVGVNAVNKINAQFAAQNLNLGTATIQVANPAALTGGEQLENDASYRALLTGYPHTIWTLDAVKSAVVQVDGVRDCRLFDPLGGTDVSQSIFQVFAFSQRRFGTQRLLGSPYYFNILVAVEPGFVWDSQPGIVGVHDQIQNAIAQIRPVSIFPNILRANNVIVGLRAQVIIKSGHDKAGVLASIKDNLEQSISSLGLGSSVFFSQVQCLCLSVPGVVDVQQLHLRRSPPLLSRVSFGNSLFFQQEVIEVAVGDNIDLKPNEIAVFEVDSELIDVEASDR